MKRVYKLTTLTICLFIASLAGFPVASWSADIFICSNCNQVYHDSELHPYCTKRNFLCKQCFSIIERYGEDKRKKRIADDYDSHETLYFPELNETDDEHLQSASDKKEQQTETTDDSGTNHHIQTETAHKINDTPDSSKILSIEDSTEFLKALFINLGAKPVEIPEETYKTMKDVESSNKNKIFPKVQFSITNWKKGDKTSGHGNTKTADLLPGFFTIASDDRDEPPPLLFEQETAVTIQHSTDRILAKKNNSQECLYLIIKDKNDHTKIKYHLLLINKSIVETGTVTLHFLDMPSRTWYKLQLENLLSFTQSINQWAAKHNHTTGMYASLLNNSCYVSRHDYQGTGFNHKTVQQIISNLCTDDDISRSLAPVKVDQYDTLLSHAREKGAKRAMEEISDLFVEWYKTIWPAPEQDKETFIVELVGAMPGAQNPMIIITNLDEQFYGLNLLEDSYDHYHIIPKDYINTLSKQFMWIADDIKMYKIRQ